MSLGGYNMSTKKKIEKEKGIKKSLKESLIEAMAK